MALQRKDASQLDGDQPGRRKPFVIVAAGRDLGVTNIATNLGQALGPIIAAKVVALAGGYGMVWVVALVLVLVSVRVPRVARHVAPRTHERKS